MAEIKIVLVNENPMLSKGLTDSLGRAGFEVTNCFGGFDALDELGSNGADIVIASTSLPDLSGYQLCGLIKSNDRTTRLPVMLIKSNSTEHDQFWETASLPDALMESSALKDAASIVTKVRELTKVAKENGWRSSMVKNLLAPSRTFASSNVINSYAGLLDDLLIERLVTRLTRNMSALAEPRKRFVDAYFSLINSLFSADVIGLVVASPQNPWSAFKIEGEVSEASFQSMMTKIKQQLNITGDLTTDLRGEFGKEEEKSMNDFELLPIAGEKLGAGALIFAASQKAPFNAQSRAFMSQLQMQMQPVVQLLLAKQEIEVLHSREAYNASVDALTGLYNLEFLIGFLQQQLLFSVRQKLAVGLAIVDIDNFAELNEKHGYELGDYIIQSIGNKLLSITRASDLVARYSGDEFAIVLPNTDDPGSRVLAEKVRTEIESLQFLSNQGADSPKVTVSVGCAQFDLKDLNPETMLRDAKLALQQAKESGKNCIVITELNGRGASHSASMSEIASDDEDDGNEETGADTDENAERAVDSEQPNDSDRSENAEDSLDQTETGDSSSEAQEASKDADEEKGVDEEEKTETSSHSKGEEPSSEKVKKESSRSKRKLPPPTVKSEISDELEDSEFELSEPEPD